MSETAGLILGEDRKRRCFWGSAPPDYRTYHDAEWGLPVADDDRLFEKICLEGFQSGLSWLTILRKRENFRRAFADFDYRRIAKFGERDVARLLADAGIVRHRGKIASTINNAERAIELADEAGSLSGYFWRFEPSAKSPRRSFDFETLKAQGPLPEAVALSKDLKKRGWTFVGPTTVYAFMQAMGMVNDHIDGCHCRAAVEKARKAFVRPG
jgi:DNA-3-methyladenine glycosylase I